VAPELLKSAPKTGTLKSVGNLNSKGSFHSAVSTRSWALPQLLAFFAERVWCIKPPKLLISLIGSTTDFEMNVIERNQILNEVMNVAKETDAWITSIGLDSGIAKHVGEAKRATGIKVPLIGIAPWGLVEGRQALWDEKADGRVMPHLESAPFDSFSEHEKQYNYMKPSKTSSYKLNRDHTHFILVDDESVGAFGSETMTRTGFEMALHNYDYESLEAVRDSLVRNKLGWQRCQLDHKVKKRTGEANHQATAIWLMFSNVSCIVLLHYRSELLVN